MVKRVVGKILVCLIAVTLCFGFVGVSETHAAAKNKVINQNTGVEYTTFRQAITALGTGSAGESTVLIVDGTIQETVDGDININYEGKLSIQGVNNATIIAPNKSDHGHVAYKINFNKKTNVEIIKNIYFEQGLYNDSGTYRRSYDDYKLYVFEVYGNVERIENIYFRSPFACDSILRVKNEGRVGAVKNIGKKRDTVDFSVNTPIIVESGATVDSFTVDDDSYYLGGSSALYVYGTVGEINFAYQNAFSRRIIVWPSGTVNKMSGKLWELYIEGQVDTIENAYVRLGTSVWGHVGTIRNSTLTGLTVFGGSNGGGSVDVLDGVTFTDDVYEYSFYGGLEIQGDYHNTANSTGGRIGKIIGNSKLYVNEADTDSWGTCIWSASEFPLYLEPDLNGQDVGNVSYGETDLYDEKGTIVFPTYKSDVDGKYYYYEFSQQPDSEGWYHLVKGNTQAPSPAVELPLSKRLVQNGTDTIPDMTFDFTFEQQSEWEGVQYVNQATNPTPIGEKSVTITESDRFTGTDDPYVGNLTGKKLYYGTYENVLSDFDPQVAGTYLYLVKERVPDPKLLNVTYTGSEYVLKVVVDSNKEIVDIPTITLYRDGTGKTKADYPNPPSVFDEKQELIFYNSYGTTGGTTPTGIMTNILPFIIIGGVGAGGLTLYVMLSVRRKRKEVS